MQGTCGRACFGADDGEDYGYRAFFDTVDVLVMGRNTYELVRTFGEWPYGTKPVVVLTSGCDGLASGEAAPMEPSRSAILAGRATNAEATIFAPGVISDSRWQYRITFTPDGKTAYYTVSDAFFPATRQGTIMVSHLGKDGTWNMPEVAPFSGTYSDIDPFITPDGQRLYFSSIRPTDGILRPDLDIWMVERTPAGWGEPIHLGPEVNTALDELYPSASADGTLYFASGPFGPTPDAGWNIFRAERVRDGFAPREPLSAVNTDLPFAPQNPTADWEFNPEISVDGKVLVFASLRPGGYGFGDLYASYSRQGEWTAPVNLGPPVNTANDEFHPTLTRNGRELYFARTIFYPSFVPGDFYRISTSALGINLTPGGPGPDAN